MNKPGVFLLALLIFSRNGLNGQSVQDSDLIAKIKVNSLKFAEWDHGPSLRDRVMQTGKDIFVNPIVKETSILCDQCVLPDSFNHPEVKRAANDSDLVVTGHVVRVISSLTKNEAFVFSDSELIIDEVWKNSKEANTSVGDEITITTPGGTVTLNGHKIRAYPSNKVPLRVNHKYLMYLKYLPDSRSYAPIGLDGFDISESTVVPLRTTIVSPGRDLFADSNVFLQAMRASTKLAVEEHK